MLTEVNVSQGWGESSVHKPGGTYLTSYHLAWW